MARISAATQHFERRVAGIEYGVLDDLVGYALRRAQIAIYEDFDAALDAFGITPQRFAALVVIAENGGISQRMLGRVLGIARSGVVLLVNGLQTRGWVAREADGDDARAWLLTLTPAGKSHLNAVRRRVRAHDRRVSRSLSDAERVQLVGLLDRLGS
jgi:DNA-binding MarR family transcriptional regulator